MNCKTTSCIYRDTTLVCQNVIQQRGGGEEVMLAFYLEMQIKADRRTL